ncbi:MAG TPA: hypothetical protein VNF03_03385 [Patescibacteria group bacterium]|nr:hypothetical protein [Patescibacteria group bacterium]
MADLLAFGWACLLAAVVGVCFVVWERVEARWVEPPARPRLMVRRRELTRSRPQRSDRIQRRAA